MKEYERFRVRLYPSNEQLELIKYYSEASRRAWNWALNEINESRDKGESCPSGFTLDKRFNEFKRRPGNEWLKKASARSMKGAIKRIHQAMKDFFNKTKGRPKFKRRGSNKTSFATHEGTFIIEQRRIRCEKLGWLKCAKHFIPYGPDIKYFEPVIIIDHGKIYFDVGVHYTQPIQGEYYNYEICNKDVSEYNIIGIDIGIKQPAVASNGLKCNRVNTDKLHKRLRRLSRRAARSYLRMTKEAHKIGVKFRDIPKSKRLSKLENKIDNIYQKIHNKITNNAHQFTSSIMKSKPDTIVIETLDIHAIIQHMPRSLRRRALESGMGMILEQLKYKSNWNNVGVINAPVDFPSTQMCSHCGYIKSKVTGDKMTLSDRTYICPICGNVMDRDENSSYNLESFGRLFVKDPDFALSYYK